MQKATFLVGFLIWAGSNPLFGWQKPNEINVISKEMAFDGWINLFSGEIQNGWRAANRANWRVSDSGAITVSQGEVGLLRTTSQFDNFTLSLQFKTEAKTNSGVFVRTSPGPRNPRLDCLEINIAPEDNPFPTGSIVGRAKAKGLGKLDYSKWHTLEISCTSIDVRVKVNGTETAVLRGPKPIGKGYIGLQHNSGPIAFRNIYLKPEGLGKLFDGNDLERWQQYPEMKGRFSVKDKLLHVEDGPGQLESKSRYADFVMQLKIRTNAPRLNSGVFFRCIPGEKMNGYESQIQNGFVNGDRSRPEDCGTGGIFRRKNARRIVGNDEEWMIKTIIVDGPHMATWVNGEPVCEWTDKRKPNPNPRKGRRLEKGTIMIQAHDPTTNIDFKNINIRELQPRRL